MVSDKLLVSTRKGLFTISRKAAQWQIAAVEFLGDNVSITLTDHRDGRSYARGATDDKGNFYPLLHTACEHAYDSDAFRILTRVFGGTGAEPLFESHGFVGMQISEEYVRDFPAFLLD